MEKKSESNDAWVVLLPCTITIISCIYIGIVISQFKILNRSKKSQHFLYHLDLSHNFTYYLMLVRSALRDLWHEWCGRVADTSRGEAECCIMPQDHNPSALNLVKHELTNIKWFIVAPWSTLSCVLTFDGVC